MGEITLYSAIFIFLSLIIGYTAQCIFEKTFEVNPQRGKMRLSRYIPILFNMSYWKIKIIIASLFNEDYKIYSNEMKKEFVPDVVDAVFFETLMKEKKSSNIDNIIEVVLQSQENKRRKKVEKEAFFLKKHFFVREMTFENGRMKGLPITRHTSYSIHYQRYLKGMDVPPMTLSYVVKYFGTIDDQTSLLIRNQLKTNELNIVLNAKKSKERQLFLDKKKMRESRGEPK